MSTLLKSGVSTLSATLWLCASAVHGISQTYTVTDLGTLSGNTISQALALNHAGVAVGDSYDPSTLSGVIFSAGRVTRIAGTPTAINNSGEIAGFYTPKGARFSDAYLHSGGSLMNLNSASLFPGGSVAFGINNSGDVVGAGYLSVSNFHAFLYSGGKMTDLGPSGAFQASAYGINASGQIVGTYALNSGASGTFLYTNSVMTTLPAAGSGIGYGYAINDNGEIAGFLFAPSQYHAAKFSNGVWTDLGVVTGAPQNEAKAINASGQIVGTSVLPSTYKPFKAGKHIPFISTVSGLVDLNTLIPAGSGFTLTDAVSINESGQILCDATNASGNEHAVLLSPLN
jgi:probable HAF family extracellular repeat protein